MGISKRLTSSLLPFLLLHAMLLSMAKARTHHYDFIVQEKPFKRLCTSKTMLTVNGSFPGPTLQARRGDTIFVNVHNHGNYGVTIHWHGVKQHRNPWSDGPEFITQCPIQPGNNFTYELSLSTEEGTLWWHAHSDWTRATVHGAIVVLPPKGSTYPFPTPDSQQTIVLGSWFKGDLKEIIETALATGATPNLSNAYTINGQPGDLYPCSTDETYRLLVDYGRTYLLRVINAVMNEDQFFGIAGHTLTVVAQDAGYIKPITTNYILITPGQTMDILVKADQTPRRYYIASTPYSDSDVIPFDNTTATAILQYNHVSGSTPPPATSIPFPTLPRYNNENAAMGFVRRIKGLRTKGGRVSVPKSVDERMYITVSLNVAPCSTGACETTSKVIASMNNVSFQNPKIDILDAYYRSLSGIYDKDFPDRPPRNFNFTGNVTGINAFAPPGTKVKVLNYGESVEIVLQGTNLITASTHPIHLHGYNFFLVGMGEGNFNNVTDPKSYNLVDPPEINTVSLPKSGWVAFRFVANNPGVWYMHCHFERHAIGAWTQCSSSKMGEQGHNVCAVHHYPCHDASSSCPNKLC